MKGTILGYYEEKKSGAISGEDGTRYKFGLDDFMGEGAPATGAQVDFDVDNGQAKEIYPLAGQAHAQSAQSSNFSGSKSKIAAGIFGLLLGGLGVHKFYLGHISTGLIMLGIFLFGFIFLGFPSTLIAIIGFIEGIIYLTKSEEDFDQIYVQQGKTWF